MLLKNRKRLSFYGYDFYMFTSGKIRDATTGQLWSAVHMRFTLNKITKHGVMSASAEKQNTKTNLKKE